MRTAVVFVVLAAMACKQSPHQPAVPAPSPAKDPWAAPAGSALDMPAWAKDPPNVLRDKINGVNAHVIVMKSQLTFAEYRDVLATVEKTPDVLKAEPFIFVAGTIRKGSGSPIDIKLKAVDPARVDGVLTIGKHMTAGSLSSLSAGDPPPIVLGDGLAHELGASLGDDLTVTLPADDQPARTKTFRLSGTFHIDFDQYDDEMAIAALPAAQVLVGRGDQVMGVEMTVNDVERADLIAKAVEAALGGPPYVAMDWYELNKPVFTALYGDKRP